MSRYEDRVRFRTLKEAVAITHTLSKPSKMPCRGYSIPAERCITGSKLREIAGSVCSICYARKGRYVFKAVQDALRQRYNSLNNPLWADAMAYQINYFAHRKRGKRYNHFRWHDSGDIQSLRHLQNIIRVCRMTPEVKHWLPTKELKLIREILALGATVPDNLVIRVSAPMLEQRISRPFGLPTSSVGNNTGAEPCLAYTRGGECGDCRLCWEKNKDVRYPRH